MNAALTVLPDPSLVVLIGASGAGKSTMAQAVWPGKVLSSDQLRGFIAGDEQNQECNREVFTALHFLLEARLRYRLLTVVDATSAYAGDRRPLLRLARMYEVPAVAVIAHPPLGVVLARNAARPRPVPEDVVRRQHRAVTDSLGSLSGEGFGHVILTTEVTSG